ncbi:carbohydrate ABC transporter permease [Leucobacter sp. NPDC015123]|uniref:carbohydrate ABC transporter permease n=1 Tax=Leucobacter sp. NPDC015123 TaxID=3364129 RepID=UPI0036F470B7
MTTTHAAPAGTLSSPVQHPKRRSGQGQGRWSALFLSPALVIITIFTVVPIVMTVVISLHEWSMFTPITEMTWVGLDNYATLFADSNRTQAMLNTGVYVVLSIVITVPLGLLIAMLLYFPKLRGQNLIRVILFSTYVIPTIAIVIIWSNIYAPGYGPLSTMLQSIGITPPGWLSDPSWALISLVIFNVWQMLGYYVILLVAGLTQIPGDLYEAARIDGAGIIRQTWSITIPMLSKTLFFVILMTFINSIQVFDPIYLLTQGGPAGSTNTISYEIQRSAFSYGLAGESSALAVTLFMTILVIGALLGVALRGRKK